MLTNSVPVLVFTSQVRVQTVIHSADKWVAAVAALMQRGPESNRDRVELTTTL